MTEKQAQTRADALLSVLAPRWYDIQTKSGLLFLIASLTGLCLAGIEFVQKTMTLNQWASFVSIAVWLVVIAATVVLWLVFSGRFNPFFCRDCYYVTISLDPESRSAFYFVRGLLKSLDLAVRDLPHPVRIRVRRIAPGLVSSTNEANRYVDSHSCHLMLWGPVHAGKSEGLDQVKLDLHITTPMPSLAAEQAYLPNYLAGIGIALVGREWQYSPDVITSKMAGAQDLTFVALSVLGVTLSLVPNHQAASVLVLQKTMDLLETAMQSGCAQSTPVAAALNLHRRQVLDAFLVAACKNLCLVYVSRKQWEDVMSLCRSIESRVNSDYEMLVWSAFASYCLGDVQTSMGYARRLVQEHPDSIIGHFDMAFLSLYVRNFSGAAKYYRDIEHRSMEDNGSMHLDVEDFLNEHVSRFPQRPEFLYARGIVEVAMGRTSLGIDSLKGFVSVARKTQNYQPLTAHAKSAIRKARSSQARSKTKRRKGRRRD